MSNFYQFISKLLNNIGLRKDHNVPQLPRPQESSLSEEEGYRGVVLNHYKKMGMTVWEYAKEKGLEGNQINFVIKKNHNILLINARDSEEDISLEDIHNFEKETNHFLKDNPVFNTYSIELRYSIPSLLLKEDAYKYIKKQGHISYEILK